MFRIDFVTIFLQDCHGVPRSEGSVPVKDEIDNYTLIRGIQNGTHTIIEFRRVLDTCDPNDYILNVSYIQHIYPNKIEFIRFLFPFFRAIQYE